MSKSKVNLRCIVGTATGCVKAINMFTLAVEAEVNLHLSSIKQIEKHEDKYFVAADNTLYSFDDFAVDDPLVVYSSSDNDIIKFDFIENGFILGYEREIRLVKDNELFCTFSGGSYSDFCLMRNGQIAVGGLNTELTVYDMMTREKPIFVGKTPADHVLSLPAKIHVTSIAQDSENDCIVYAGSKFNTVQLFDIRSNQRKAQNTANFDINYAVSGLTALSDHKVIAASSQGTLGIIDFRYIPKNKLPTKNVVSRYEKFSGKCSGSISGMAIAAKVNVGNNGKKRATILATSAMDRHVRIYNLETRDMLDKIYVDAKATCVMIDSINESNNEDMWRALDVVEESTTTQKRALEDYDITSDQKRSKEH